MDKVLKQRLVGASILIALAVIFLPMLFDGGKGASDGQRELTIDVPERDPDDRQVRRLALDPGQARRPPDESQARPPEQDRGAPPARRSEPQPLEPRPEEEPPAARPIDGKQPGEAADRQAAEIAADEQTDAAAEAPATADGTAAAQTPAETAERAPDEAPSQAATGEPGEDAAEGDWVVQVAVFSSRETANAIRQRLSELGHRVSLEVLIRDQAELFRLRTGPYANEAAAARARSQIEATVAGVDPVARELAAAGSAADRHGLAVQVGSFASRNNAERLVGQLTEAGFDAFMYGEETGGRTIWRVRVGAYEERAAAERLLETLRDEEGLEGIVVSHP